jgi:hypothetical protein
VSDVDKILVAVEKFSKEMFGEEPALDDLVQRARSGSMDLREIIKETWRIAAIYPHFEEELRDALCVALGLDVMATDLALFPDREQILERWGFTDEDLVYQPFEGRSDYKMLHPLLMGMIVELIQFDGDVPELRTGRMPEGGSPAVPVETTAYDPVIIGAMLRTASAEVAAELRAAEDRHDRKVAELEEAIAGERGADDLVRRETGRTVGVPGYEPGKRPHPRRVEEPVTSEVARLPFRERQELAHRTLTSTQGRRSAATVIAKVVLEGLRDRGFIGISLGKGSEPFAEACWIVSIDGGRGERNPNFNFVVTAARAMTTKLGKELGDRVDHNDHLCLQVNPINEVSERRVGWRAVLWK